MAADVDARGEGVGAYFYALEVEVVHGGGGVYVEVGDGSVGAFVHEHVAGGVEVVGDLHLGGGGLDVGAGADVGLVGVVGVNDDELAEVGEVALRQGCNHAVHG